MKDERKEGRKESEARAQPPYTCVKSESSKKCQYSENEFSKKYRYNKKFHFSEK
jgi:hypothetical protein